MGKGKKNIFLIMFFLVFLLSTVSALETSEIRELLDATTVRIDLLDENEEIASFGSGFFVSETGMILTNFHVIEDSIRDNMPIWVNLQNGRSFEADILHWNARRDWAVLQIYSNSQFDYLEFAEDVQILDNIWAAGYPITGNFKIIGGMINSYQPDFFEDGLDYYDVSMNFDGGNSGGPVINDYGEVVGIVVAYYTEARAFDFIIPINEVAEEVYWLRFLNGSTAYIPSRISGVQEVGYLSDYFLITNDTGYDIWYLHIMTDEMFADDMLGDDLLGEETLYDGYYAEIDLYSNDMLYDAVYVDWDQRLHILAEDADGDFYYLEWYPDSDPWDIEIAFDDLTPFSDIMILQMELQEELSSLQDDYDYDNEEVGYLSDYFLITNTTGYDIWYLHVMTDEMFSNDDPGEDLLGDDVLSDGYSARIDPYINEWLYDPLYVDWDQRLHVLAADLNGIFYYTEWYPDDDPWDIVLGAEDITESADVVREQMEAHVLESGDVGTEQDSVQQAE